MASTNKTTHYELPQWIGTDKPTFLGDLNQAFEDIDTGIYNAATAASNAASAAGSAQSAASTAQSAAESAASTASAANTLATTANTNAVTALNAIGSTPLQTQAQTLTAAVNEVLHDVPDDATDIPYDNQTSGLTATNVQGAIDEIAQGGGGGLRLVETAAANQTYAAQAATLYAAYQNLTLEEKLSSFIVNDDNTILRIEALNAAIYSRHAENDTAIYGNTLWLAGSAYYGSTGTTVTNNSNTTNTGTLKLYVVD